MKKISKLMLTLTLLVVGVSVKAETVITKTPVILTGGVDGCNPDPTCYGIQMKGWQNFVAYDNSEGIAFDETSTMVFNLKETVNNGQVRVTFTFSDGTTQEAWWCLGIGNSADDNTLYYGHAFDGSTYYLKKGLGDSFESKKSLKITKVIIQNFNYTVDNTAVLVTYDVIGGTICGTPMTIKQGNATTFGYYGGVFSPTAAQKNIFKMTNFEVGDYQKLVIKFGDPTPSSWAIVTAGGYPPSLPTGVTEYKIDLDGSNLSEFSIFNWNANPTPINISEVYLYKEEESNVLLSFNEVGFATTNKKDLKAAGGLSYNPSTGVLTSDGTAGTLTLEFTNPVNLEDLNTFDVKRSGNNNNIVNRLKFYESDGTEINTWNNAKWYNAGLDNNATRAFKNHNDVKKLVWEADANEGNNGQTLTITGIEWQLKTISAMKGTDITTLPYKLWSADGDNDATVVGDVNSWECAKKFGVLTGDPIYGCQNIGDSKKYVDLTNYKKLIVRGYGTIRLFYNWHQSTGEGDPELKPIDVTSFVNSSSIIKTMELDIPTFMANNGYSHFHLIGVKGNGQCYVESISVLDGTEKYDYTLSGRGGLMLPTAIDALADENATAIDATAMNISTEFKEELTPTNPNCLIVANADQLLNTKNVIVEGTCANLELTDGHPFKAPADFTATAAKYTTTISSAGAGTLCLPFEATIPEGVKAYTLNYTSGEAADATKVTGTIAANTPVLLNGSGEATFTGSNANVVADAANTEGALTGVFEKMAVPVGSYVLQNQDDGIGFYKVAEGSVINAKPFRAYLTAQSAARSLKINFPGTTGVQTVAVEAQHNGEVYDLQGRRVAQPVKGLYIVNGKKMMVK